MQDSSSLAKSIIENEARPPPPLKKVVNMKTGFPKAKPISREIKIQVKEPEPLKLEDLAVEEYDGENQNDKPFEEKTVRFDFHGNDTTNMKETPESHDAGLHQHNDNTEKPGYAIYELAVLCRSQNTAQRAFALATIANIVRKNFTKCEKDIKEAQIPVIAVNALFPPTNLSIKTAALDLITQLLFSQFKDPFAIYPYPAIPPETSMTLEFSQFASDFLEIAKKEEQCLDFLALFTLKEDLDLSLLTKMPPSIPLFHLSRSLFIGKGTIFAKNQAISVINSASQKANQNSETPSDSLNSNNSGNTSNSLSSNNSLNSEFLNEDLVKEAAVVLRFFKEIPDFEILDNLKPNILAILLSRCDNIEKYVKYLPFILPLCPDPFAIEFIANLASKNLISKDEVKKVLENETFRVAFSPSYVTLVKFTEKELKCPELPKTIEECWEKRDLICGVSEYILQTKDLRILPKLLPCLYSFTNPAADILINSLLGMQISSERPIDPNEIFEKLGTCEAKYIPRILSVSRYFPLHYSLPIFDREDEEEISPIVCNFLDNFDDPLPPESLRPLDLSKFFERFLFDCFLIPSYQKMVFFCVSMGASAEVRQHFWVNCSKYLSRIHMKNVRKDIINNIETDREILACMVQALKESKHVETDILMIAVHHLREYLIKHKGEMSGEVFFEHCRRLPEFWTSKILSFMDK